MTSDQEYLPPRQDGAAADEAALWEQRNGSRNAQARNTLFALYAGFARTLARRELVRRSHGDLEFGDLYQLACSGLLEAIDRFDPTRGAPFKSFAAHRITGSIANGIAQMSEIRGQQSANARMRRERLQSLSLGTTLPRTAAQAVDSLAEIAVGLALGFMLEGTGLYLVDEAEPSRRHQATGYESAAWREMVGRLNLEIEALEPRERMILSRHYNESLNFDSLATLLGITKGRISQIHKAALMKLRKRLAQRGHFTLER